VVRLESVPALETAVALPPGALKALLSWQSRPGEIVTLVDSQENYYRARLTNFGIEEGEVVPFQRFAQPAESRIALEVYQALPEKERFELILQKLTEIGVSRIVPYTSEHSTTQEERDAGQRKSHRWPDVVLRAAKQCRRAMIPELYPVVSWDEAIYHAAGADLKLMLFEGETGWSLGEALRGENACRVALLVGPEGGFSGEEVADARQCGFLPVSLGPRILRTETAAILGAGIIQYHLGDLG
jgi:16S rRNA (uracil1498-N3)-methyltransferase